MRHTEKTFAEILLEIREVGTSQPPPTSQNQILVAVVGSPSESPGPDQSGAANSAAKVDLPGGLSSVDLSLDQAQQEIAFNPQERASALCELGQYSCLL